MPMRLVRALSRVWPVLGAPSGEETVPGQPAPVPVLAMPVGDLKEIRAGDVVRFAGGRRVGVVVDLRRDLGVDHDVMVASHVSGLVAPAAHRAAQPGAGGGLGTISITETLIDRAYHIQEPFGSSEEGSTEHGRDGGAGGRQARDEEPR